MYLSFLILGEKITPSACLEGSKLLLLSKPLFNSFADVFLSQTTEKREVSSGKYLGFGDSSVINNWYRLKTTRPGTEP